MKNSFPKKVFRTLHPQFEVSETYEISITPIPGAADPHECWIVRQMHGYFDEFTKTFHNVVETLSPAGERQFLTCAEAISEANELVLAHAQNGFRFLFVTRYMDPTPPWYECVEVLASGEYKPLSQSLTPRLFGDPAVEVLKG